MGRLIWLEVNHLLTLLGLKPWKYDIVVDVYVLVITCSSTWKKRIIKSNAWLCFTTSISHLWFYGWVWWIVFFFLWYFCHYFIFTLLDLWSLDKDDSLFFTFFPFWQFLLVNIWIVIILCPWSWNLVFRIDFIIFFSLFIEFIPIEMIPVEFLSNIIAHIIFSKYLNNYSDDVKEADSFW